MKPAALLLCLLVTVLVQSQGSAASSVLYETGWEALPATPAWAPGNLWPQNSWDISQNDDPASNRVVSNGTPDANPFGTAIVAASGSQFHRFTASSSTTANVGSWSWANLGDVFDSRPAGYDILTGSIDMYIPSGASSDGSSYGLFGYDDSVDGNFLDYGFLVVPNSRSIRMLLDGAVTASVPAAFSYNTWFTVALVVDYTSGDVSVLVNGSVVTGLAGTNPYIIGSTFTDLDLFSQNSKTAPNPRVVFSDNYRVSVGPRALVRPTLTITPGAIGEWHLSWSADYFDWILESTQDITATTWVNEGVTPDVAGGVASVDLPNAPPRTFYRLRQP